MATETAVPAYVAIKDDILLCESKDITAENCMVLFPKKTILPSMESISLKSTTTTSEFFVFRSGDTPNVYELLGEVCFNSENVSVDVSVDFKLACVEGNNVDSSSVGLSISISGNKSFFIPLSA